MSMNSEERVTVERDEALVLRGYEDGFQAAERNFGGQLRRECALHIECQKALDRERARLPWPRRIWKHIARAVRKGEWDEIFVRSQLSAAKIHKEVAERQRDAALAALDQDGAER
jgi:hypothetical protein